MKDDSRLDRDQIPFLHFRLGLFHHARWRYHVPHRSNQQRAHVRSVHDSTVPLLPFRLLRLLQPLLSLSLILERCAEERWDRACGERSRVRVRRARARARTL